MANSAQALRVRRAGTNNGIERSGKTGTLALDRFPVVPRRLDPTVCFKAEAAPGLAFVRTPPPDAHP
jgi:hypothetical protein